MLQIIDRQLFKRFTQEMALLLYNIDDITWRKFSWDYYLLYIIYHRHKMYVYD